MPQGKGTYGSQVGRPGQERRKRRQGVRIKRQKERFKKRRKNKAIGGEVMPAAKAN